MITNIVIWFSSFAFITLFKGEQTFQTSTLVLLLFSLIPFQLFFLSTGLMISLLLKRIRSVTPFSMGLGFGMYIISVFSDMLGENKYELITPFKHFEATYIIQNGAYDLPLVLLSLSVVAISLAGSYLLYNRRDIPAIV